MKARLIFFVALAFAAQAVLAQHAPVIAAKNPEALFTSRDPKLHRNKQVVLHIVRDLLEAGHWSDAGKYLTERYIQHHPGVPSGLKAVKEFFKDTPRRPIPKPNEWKTKVVSVVAEGDLVVVATVRELKDSEGKPYTTTWFDMWRIRNGKADEHWDGATLTDHGGPGAP
jgi:predicted SnoaL-like aldol condensation-catalyzing enzyme